MENWEREWSDMEADEVWRTGDENGPHMEAGEVWRNWEREWSDILFVVWKQTP